MEARYRRNLGALTQQECSALREKAVLIAGCGGLGGFLLEHFLRMGVGAITVCDSDRFEETNLNRQLLCTTRNLGQCKAEAAALRALEVNPQVEFRTVTQAITSENADQLLRGHDLVLDALDSVADRRMLAEACARQKIPLIHGAVRDWCAQVATLPPGSGLLDTLYPGDRAENEAGGSLSPTVSLCAAIQAAEAIKLLCGRTPASEERILYADLLTQNYLDFPL